MKPKKLSVASRALDSLPLFICALLTHAAIGFPRGGLR